MKFDLLLITLLVVVTTEEIFLHGDQPATVDTLPLEGRELGGMDEGNFEKLSARYKVREAKSCS